MVTNTTPTWSSYQATGNIADIVSSPTVAAAIGGKVDGENGQSENMSLLTPVISRPTISGGSASGLDLSGAVVTATGGTVSRKLPTKLAETISVKDFGAVGDGVTDDTSAIQAALNSGISTIYVPQGTYYITSTISILPKTALIGLAPPIVSNPPNTGCVFLFAATVSTCVQMGTVGGQAGFSSRLENVAILRSTATSTTIPSGSIGVAVNNTQASVLENVTVYGHDIGFYLKAANPDGITSWLNMCNTGRIQTSHLVVDSLPEFRVSNSRFGMNGVGDLSCTNFVSITGGNTTNAAGGPNTGCFVNCQFNQGQNTVTNWVNFNNQTTSSIADTGYLTFDSCYVETVVNGIVSDSTWPIVRRLVIGDCELSRTGTNWFNLNSATTLQDSVISNTIIYGNIAMSCTMSKVSFSNIVLTGTMSMACTFSTVSISNLVASSTVSFASQSSSSTLMISSLMAQGAITVSGAWSIFAAPTMVQASMTSTATGNVYFGDVVGQTHTNSYTAAFGLNNYTITYGTNGKFSLQKDGNGVFYNATTSSALFSVSPVTNTAQAYVPFILGKYTVANLPTTSTVSGLVSGSMAYAVNALKPGESSGSGTGIPVFYNADGTWRSICTGAAVAS